MIWSIIRIYSTYPAIYDLGLEITPVEKSSVLRHKQFNKDQGPSRFKYGLSRYGISIIKMRRS